MLFAFFLGTRIRGDDPGPGEGGRGDPFEFRVEKGTITPALTSFLLAEIPRPVMTAVLPELPGEPRFRAPVKHVRGRKGSHGELLLYPGSLVFQSEQPGASRYWRFGDLASVLRLDRPHWSTGATDEDSSGSPRAAMAAI